MKGKRDRTPHGSSDFNGNTTALALSRKSQTFLTKDPDTCRRS
jgi:hypothetical protein